MATDLLRACRGAENYIFVSYAHKDGADVRAAIEALAAKGCRVWYDEGIEAGDDWAKKIGTSLEQASLVLFFASKHSVKSENCLRELAFAKEHGIPVLTVTMGQCKMPDEFQRMLFVEQTANLASFKTYGLFVQSVAPVLDKYGVGGGTTTDIPDRKIVFEAKQRGRKKAAVAAACVAVAAALGFAAFALLFRNVPAVVGLDADTARSQVEAAEFDVNVSLNYSDEYDYGVIFDQSAEGRTLRFVPVVITQSLGPEENLTDVPDTVGRHISDGAKLLVAAGMTKFAVVPELSTDAEPAYIFAQSIPAGLRVSHANVIDLSVATDGGEITFELDGKIVTISGTEPVTIDTATLPAAEPETVVEPEPEPEAELEPEPEPVDEYGMTAAERAYWDALVIPFFGGENRKGYPFVDGESVMHYAESVYGGVAYLARDMTIANEPDWADMYTEFIIPPGVTVTLEGSGWHTDFGFVVMEGATLIVNGNVAYQYGVNHGTLIVNGTLRTTYHELDQWGLQWGELGNGGRLIVNGSCAPSQLWSYAGGTVTGDVQADRFVDRTYESAPPWANGPQGFGTIACDANANGTA